LFLNSLSKALTSSSRHITVAGDRLDNRFSFWSDSRTVCWKHFLTISHLLSLSN